MTSAATQAIANTNEPAYGTILSHQVVENGHGVSLQRYLHHYWSLKSFSN